MSNLANAHWRDAARSVRFFIWDGKTAFPFLLFLIHMSWVTFWIAGGAVIFFSILNRYGFSPIVFWRWLRNICVGPKKPAIPWWEEKV